jgi:membrane associated rhomboid family serine protease
MAVSGYRSEWIRFASAFAAFTLVAQVWPGLSQVWRFSRPAFEGGAWWLLVTSQWIHLSGLHAVVNVAAMALMLLALDHFADWHTQAISMLGGYAGVAVAIAVDPACMSYAGASGALHGFLAGSLVTVLATRAGAIRALAFVALIALAIKLWVQHDLANSFTGWLGFPTYYPAHEAGSLGGVIAILLWLVWHRMSPAQRRTR